MSTPIDWIQARDNTNDYELYANWAQLAKNHLITGNVAIGKPIKFTSMNGATNSTNNLSWGNLYTHDVHLYRSSSGLTWSSSDDEIA